MTDDDLLKKLLSKKQLIKSEKARLRQFIPQEKFESLILRLSQNKNDRSLIRQLHKAQNILYPKKKKKKFRAVATINGNIVDNVVSGGLPGTGKKR